MTRPIYEKESDRQNEVALIPVLQSKFNCHVERNKRLFCADYSFLRNKQVVAIGDLKCRTNKMNKYDTYMISAIKFSEGRTLAANLKVPFILVVRWIDSIGWFDLRDIEDFEVQIGGRTDRGDEADIEPVVHITLDKFKVLS